MRRARANPAAAVSAICAGARHLAFGHFGDGNVHYNIAQPVGMQRAAFMREMTAKIEEASNRLAGITPPNKEPAADASKQVDTPQ